MNNIRFLFLLSISLMCLFSNLLSVGADAPTRAKIVFTSNRDGNGEIYTMNADGSGEVRLTNHPGDDFDPVWSPSGEHIAFVSEREHEGLYDIYLMDANGQNIRRAFGELDYRTAPTWSPDGENIAYHTYSPVPDWAVYFNGLGDGKPERLSEASMRRGGFPSWSPDGTKLAFYWWKRDEQEAGIYIVNRDGKKLEEIVKNAKGMIAWAPSGKELIYSDTVDGQRQLLKIDIHSRIKAPLAPLGPIIRRRLNSGWDWFDPKGLPVSAKPELLTTTWGKMKAID